MLRYYSNVNWRKTSSRLNRTNLQVLKNLKYENYLVLDFESTCGPNIKTNEQEIIEFPCIWTDSSFNVVSTFHRYVKPVHNPILSQYCTELTGISQAKVETEETFDKVLASFLDWLQNNQNLVGNNSKTKTFVTCGDWDLKVMLPDQCQLSLVPVPSAMTQWLNVKKLCFFATRYYPKSLKDMCNHLGIKFTGREHSGINDCRNIIEILKALQIHRPTTFV